MPRTGRISTLGAASTALRRCPLLPKLLALSSLPPAKGPPRQPPAPGFPPTPPACRIAGHPLDTKAPAIRETLRGIGRKHGFPPRRSAALTIADMRKLVRACGTALAGT